MFEKLKILFLLCCVLILVLFTGGVKPSLEKDNLKGRVKKLTVTKYRVVEKAGKILKEAIITKTISKYDLKGNIIEHYVYNDGKTVSSEYKCEYDKAGNLVKDEQINVNIGIPLFIKIYKYDDKNNKVEEDMTDYSGKIATKTKCKYENGYEIESLYNSDGSVYSVSKQKYDKNGNLTEIINYDSHGAIENRWEMKYDSGFNMVEKTQYHLNTVLKTQFQYNKDRDVIKEDNYENGNPIGHRTYRYSNVDKQRNWLTSTTLLNVNMPINVDDRIIEYY